MKQQYPNAAELLLSLVIDSIVSDECTSSDGIKQRLSELVDNVFEPGTPTSPTPPQSTRPAQTLRVNETLVAQVPKFLDFLNKENKKRTGKSRDQAPKKRRKKNDGSLDPTSFSDEDELINFEGNSSE